jgi:hypothetical protein
LPVADSAYSLIVSTLRWSAIHRLEDQPYLACFPKLADLTEEETLELQYLRWFFCETEGA